MENLSIKIDLAKLNGAFIKEIAGRTETKNCLVIPINDASLFQGQKGIYLDLLAREMKDSRYGDTHIVKQNLPKEKYQALTEDERRNQPILGSGKSNVRLWRLYIRSIQRNATTEHPIRPADRRPAILNSKTT